MAPRRKKKTPATEETSPVEVAPIVVPDEEEIKAPFPEVEVLPADAPADAPAALPVEEDGAEAVEVETEAKESGLVRYDSLQAYLAEIRRLPRLSREEEHELALRYLKEKDMEAAYRLIQSNLWLVVKIARDYERAARSLLDLIQEGSIGLMEAVKNFDPFRNVRFPSYAAWWIRAYIVRYVIANWRMVKIGTTQAQRKLFFNLKKEKEKLEREGLFPQAKLLAEKLEVRESDVIEMEQRLASSDVSVDAPIDSESDATLLSMIPSGANSAEDIVASRQMREILADSLREFEDTLNVKERTIFSERMLGEEKATLQEMADKLSVSRERVRQIENKIRDKLKSFLEPRLKSGLVEFGE